MRNRFALVSITLGSLLALGTAGCGNGDDASTQPLDAAPPSDATTSDAKSDASDAAGDAEHDAGDAGDAGAGDAGDAGDAGHAGDAGDAGDAAEDAPSDAPADG
jgi:hypothetical protein